MRLQELIERIGNLLAVAERRGANTAGLQPVHLRVLNYLLRCNRYSNTPAAVASFLGLTRGTVSQSVILLERGGYVRKRADAEDGRVVRLQVTAKGRRLQALSPAWSTAIEAIDATDVDAATRTLEALLRSLQRAQGGKTFGECHSCRHLLREGRSGQRCGLTGETLSGTEVGLICHEHEPAA